MKTLKLNKNFFLKGERISEPTLNDSNLLEFKIRVKQPKNHEFLYLYVQVSVLPEIWEKFLKTGTNSKYLEVSGFLDVNRETPDSYWDYYMIASDIRTFNYALYDISGGECYFYGIASVIAPKQKDFGNMFVRKLFLETSHQLTTDDKLFGNRQRIYVTAMRANAKKIDQLNLKSDSLVRLRANLMPSVNKNAAEHGKPSFLSLREIKVL